MVGKPYLVITSRLGVILSQLHETIFADLLQAQLRSSSRYSLRNHSTSCSRVALPFARLTSDS